MSKIETEDPIKIWQDGVYEKPCPIETIEEELNSMREYQLKADEESAGIQLVGGNGPLGLFVGHLRELPGGGDSRGFYTTQESWRKIPEGIKKILKNPKYGVDIYF